MTKSPAERGAFLWFGRSDHQVAFLSSAGIHTARNAQRLPEYGIPLMVN